MYLKEVSPLMSRSFQDNQGGTTTINWVEMTLTDGLDNLIAELIVNPERDTSGQLLPVRQPEFATERWYTVALEICGNCGVNKEGKYWSMNRIKVKKIIAL